MFHNKATRHGNRVNVRIGSNPIVRLECLRRPALGQCGSPKRSSRRSGNSQNRTSHVALPLQAKRITGYEHCMLLSYPEIARYPSSAIFISSSDVTEPVTA